VERLELLKEHLRDPGPTIWREPFYKTWIAGEGLSNAIRLAKSQSAEMAAARPFVKPGELIIGNNALRSVITGLPSPFGTGMRFQGHYIQSRLDEDPESQSEIDEIESFWAKWQSENGQYTPMTCHASLAYEIPLTVGLDGMREHVKYWRGINTPIKPDCADWYDALLITLDGVSAFIKAHAKAAEEAAITVPDVERRMELERIAVACHNVANKPPASFHEAVQLFYLMFCICGHDSPKPLELALNNGIDPMTGNQMGPATGKAENFDTYEEFEQAYRQQMDHHISQHIQNVNRRREVIKDHAYDFLRSLLTHSCVEHGLDWHNGGADYSEGMVDMVGLTTVTDSLMAIKRGVYEEEKVSLKELVDILNSNWDGAENLRLYLLHKVPKFGNDLDEADTFTVNEFSRINDFIKSHKTHFGGPWGMDIIGWSGAVIYGLDTGATPDGRRQKEALADCAGPAQGRNILGLTPTLRSVLKLPHNKVHGPMALSLRFPSKVVEGEDGRAKLRSTIETYFQEGGQQLQISIASTEDMRAAQRDPELYRSLMVRVGGFSAYFTQLDKNFQDDMIARSELEI
jgi:pyruvate-formate lyase